MLGPVLSRDLSPTQPRVHAVLRRLRRHQLPPWAALLLSIAIPSALLVGGAGLGILGLRWLLAGTMPQAPWYRQDDESIKQFVGEFRSGGRNIPIEQFEPKQPGKYPLVLLVHGSDGLHYGSWQRYYRGHAQELARHGYVVLLPHYFERTGTTLGDRQGNKEHFVDWLQTLGDALDYAEKQPHIDASRIGVFGVSLGCYLSTALASCDRRVDALVACVGGVPEPVADHIVHFPPTLILHGDADRMVSVGEAHKLERLLHEKGVEVESKIYPGQGHGFYGEAAQDSAGRIRQFLDRHIKTAR